MSARSSAPRSRAYAALGALAGLGVLAALVLVPAGRAAELDDALALPEQRPVVGQLKPFDATAAEPGCQTKGRGRGTGSVEATFDRATRTISYTLSLSGAEPRTQYALDISECERGGERIARGDGGHLRTDADGNGTLEGTWTVQTDARWVRASLVSYCPGPSAEDMPVSPCGPPVAFSTDALVPPGR